MLLGVLFFIRYSVAPHIGVNPGRWGSRPPDFGQEVVGVAGGSRESCMGIVDGS